MSSTNQADSGPLVVSVKRAKVLLDLSHHQIYRLINRGELQSAKFGKARRITVASIQEYIKRHGFSEILNSIAWAIRS